MKRYVAWRITATGKRVPLHPGGKRVFGPLALAWLKRRAKRRGYRWVYRPVRTRVDRAVAFIDWCLAHEAPINYAQIRPMPLAALAKRALPWRIDCSTFGTFVAKVAGWRDPNGRNYDGTGFTGTTRANCPRIDPAKGLRPGDLIIHGTGTGAHETVVRKTATNLLDTVLASHGQESGPRLYTLRQEIAVHGTYYTCHRPFA